MDKRSKLLRPPVWLRTIPLAAPLATLLAALLTACASVPETQYFTLGRVAPATGSLAPAALRPELSLGVDEFEAEGVYTRDRLLYRQGRFQITPDYYRAWALPTQALLAEKTVEYLRGANLFGAVRRLPALEPVNLLLTGRIGGFEELTTPEYLASFEFSLQDPRSRERLWWGTVTATIPIGPVHSAESIVAAAQASVQECLRQLADSLSAVLPRLTTSATAR